MVCSLETSVSNSYNDVNLSEGIDPLEVAKAMSRRGIVLVFNES
jgi:hypothetical protein